MAQITTAINDETFPLQLRIIVKLSIKFGLRPIQFALLREDDLFFDESSEAWYLNVPRVKGRTAQLRRNPNEFVTRELPTELAQDILSLIEEQIEWIEYDNSDELLPRPLFKAKELDSVCLAHSKLVEYSWHRTARSISQMFTKSLPCHLNLYSKYIKDDDGNPLPLKMNAYRFRYTLGTRMVMEGKTPEEVALALDHSSTWSVAHYFRYNRDIIDFIDDSFEGSKSLKDAVARWQGYLISEDDNIEGSLIKITDVMALGRCLRKSLCPYHPTISCYGCSKFRPFKDADHSSQLKVIKQERDFIKQHSSGPVQYQLDEAYEGAVEIVIAQQFIRENE